MYKYYNTTEMEEMHRYVDWYKKAKILLKYKYDMDLDNYKQYDFLTEFENGTKPRELIERLAKTELDLP